MIRVLLIDDHALVRQGLRAILAAAPDIDVVGEAGSGIEGVSAARVLRPTVVLVDLLLPDISGHEVLDRLQRQQPETRCLIVTASTDLAAARRLLDAGAAGFIGKAGGADQLLAAVRRLARGERYLSADLAEALALMRIDGRPTTPFSALSSRELEVARMLVAGRGLADIAERLHLSAKTVATYKYRLLDKLGVAGEVGLVHLALRHGLVEPAALP